MRLIAHRGNINGVIKEHENTPDQIMMCIESFGFDVEIDVWDINGNLFLGHDAPTIKIEHDFLYRYSAYLWVHCKNIEAINSISGNINKFFHDTDDCTLTSRGFVWTYPGKSIFKNSICVKPEICAYPIEDLTNCAGICSDVIIKYQDLLKQRTK
jgi:hypothetical protein